MSGFFEDVRYGARLLAKRPGFTTVAVLTLALGIGAVTAMYSLMGPLLLPRQGIGDSGRIATLWAVNPKAGVERGMVSAPNYVDWKHQAASFEDMAAFQSSTTVTLTGAGQPLRLQAERVTANFFRVLGAQPQIGRNFSDADASAGGPGVAIISHSLWRKQFGGDRNILGQKLKLDGTPYEIIGVLRESFAYPAGEVDIWTPFAPDAAGARTGGNMIVLGRMRDAATAESAQSEMDTVAARLERQYPASNTGWRVNVIPVEREQRKKAALGLVFFFGSVLAVLLLACVNVANLLLARLSGRATEMAMRTALGAARSRLIRQLLTENLLLAVGGGGLGIFLAYWGLMAGRAAMSRFQPRVAQQLAMDWQVLVFAAVLSVLTLLIFGIAPAIYATRVNLNDALKRGGLSGGPYAGLSVNRRPTLVLEIALAVPFLVIMMLFAHGMRNVREVLSSGFDQHHVLTVTVSPAPAKYLDPAALAKYYGEVRRRLSALPGVELVGAGDRLPVPSSDWGGGGKRPVQVESGMKISQQPSVKITYAAAGYLDALRVPLLAGRMLAAADSDSAPVAVISREMARRFWDDDAIGRRFRLSEQEAWITVVGIVGDVGYAGGRAPQPAAYVAIGSDLPSPLSFVARTSGDPKLMVEAAKRAVWSVDPEQPLDQVAPLERVFSDDLSGSGFVVGLMGVFGWLAFLLAAVGVYSIASYSVAQRTREFGVRMALGARRKDIHRLVLGGGLRLALAGIGLGWAIAWAMTRLVAHELVNVGVSSVEPTSYGAVALALATAALFASYVPGRRATHIDPVVALRYE